MINHNLFCWAEKFDDIRSIRKKLHCLVAQSQQCFQFWTTLDFHPMTTDISATDWDIKNWNSKRWFTTQFLLGEKTCGLSHSNPS